MTNTKEAVERLAKEAREEFDAHREWLIENPDEQDFEAETIFVQPRLMIAIASELSRLEEENARLTKERDEARMVVSAAKALVANIEQDSGGLWFVNSEDPEALCCDLLNAVNAATLTTKETGR